jgi:3-hydroxymyristoyl/3-hydroxydecanoyl-(acyl carrier protein) dehydratase
MNGLPVILAQRADATRSELELGIEADNPWFEGHFPGQPILPGVVQIGWAVHFAHTLHSLGPEVVNLEQIKFKRPIFPGARLTLRLTPSADRQTLRYEYCDAETSYSSGLLNYGTAA